jgi:hypothetical protein
MCNGTERGDLFKVRAMFFFRLSRMCLKKSDLMTKGFVAIVTKGDHEPAPSISYCDGLFPQD